MTISIGPLVDRGAPAGTRRCDGCLKTGGERREGSIPSGSSSHHRDCCGRCVDRLKRMPRLPEQGRAAAWEKALADLRAEGGRAPLGAKSGASSPAGDIYGPTHL